MAVSRAREKSFSYQRRLCCNILHAAGIDIVTLSAAFLVADLSRSLLFGPMMLPGWLPIVFAFWLFGGAVLQTYPGWGLSPVALLQRLTILNVGVFGATATYLFLSQTSGASRYTILLAFLLATVFVPLGRITMKALLCGRGTWGLPAVVYGLESSVESIADRLREERGTGYTVCGCFTPSNRPAAELPSFGGLNEATVSVPLAILSTTGMPREQVENLLRGPLSCYRRVILICEFSNLPTLWLSCRDLGGVSGFEVAHNLLDPWRQCMKRAVELGAIIATIPLWGSISAIAAFLIWLEDRENPFFRQARVGLNGERFMAWKFRTMVPEAEEILRRKLEEDGAFRAQWEAGCKVKGDPRVTRVGRFLRRTSLDEIPQLINVLRGEMSIAGPRPLPAYHHNGLPREVRELRERVRPGITGLWQVSGRSDCGNAGMTRWDPYYVYNWSIWLDIVILVRTVRAVIRGGGAY